jgi:hypothetical protein
MLLQKTFSGSEAIKKKLGNFGAFPSQLSPKFK